MADPISALAAIYATVPRLECRGKCQHSCGPIMMSPLEWARLTDARHGITPEAGPMDRFTLHCPMLDHVTGRCTTYAVRPLICRLWGVVQAMRCPHGCVPERWLSDAEARELLAQVATLSPGASRCTYPEFEHLYEFNVHHEEG